MGLETAVVFRKEGRVGLGEKVTCEQRLAGGEGVHSIWERRGGARSGVCRGSVRPMGLEPGARRTE